MAYFRSFFKKKQNSVYEIVVLTDLDKIYERKFKIKILVKFKNNSMCYIEMKPLCPGSRVLFQQATG